VSVGPKKTSITNVEKFSVIDFETGKEMFSTRDDMALLLDGGVTNLRSPAPLRPIFWFRIDRYSNLTG
jgi:hypothetical protein